ncbi:porin [Sutterella sp. AF15-45LB]|jgi:predicted porin|nr:porin [Sutterella sp. AF15-45LB]RGU81355.1 porin [Sutterella sp. AF15-44LB]RHH05661.1 porin [Sutterella sp. AM18-8-1]
MAYRDRLSVSEDANKSKENKLRKSLTAIAALLAAVGIPSAADAASSVSVYGLIDSYVSVNNDSGTVSSGLHSGGSSGNYFGFKGEEDLGVLGGAQAVFKLESGFLSDDGTYAQSFAGNTSRLFHREAWVGLRSPMFGQISFGRQYSPHFLLWPMTDANALSLGTAGSPFFYPGAGNAMGGSDPTQDDLVRANNSIFWASPNLGGVTVMAYAALGENTRSDGTKSSTQGNIYNLGVNYGKGPLFVMGSVLYQNLGNSALGFRPTGHDTYYELAASYDFGFTKPSIQFEYKNGNDQPWSQDFFLIQIGTSTPLLGGRLGTTAAYYKNQTLSKADAYSFGIRYDYSLSKRTMLYAGTVALIQEANAQFSIEDGPDSSFHYPTSAPGNDVQQVFFGIRHQF